MNNETEVTVVATGQQWRESADRQRPGDKKGAKVKLRKANSSVAMSFCRAAWGNSAPDGRIFTKFDI